jgi:hypothetical protein
MAIDDQDGDTRLFLGPSAVPRFSRQARAGAVVVVGCQPLCSLLEKPAPPRVGARSAVATRVTTAERVDRRAAFGATQLHTVISRHFMLA